ncbi:protein phosphatase 1 regulatory subunit 26 isoform X1 [Amblyraja radiata]|uniref:protein phosphatase 1 regulatory subunit 26 isoform X1 n=2 Tax=Amblyraja radiata TaxID=386614 RepID=UPI001402A7D5|nr:protein phosphatase 1 regulatory subunit 26 isoform X1 [Amblyraja radiata]
MDLVFIKDVRRRALRGTCPVCHFPAIMFLMNLAPVSAVQTDWQPFGASQSYSLPVVFSPPGEKFSPVGSAINVNVQMIVENLQPHDPSRARNNDPSSNAQTNLVSKWRSEGVMDDGTINVLKGAAVEDLKTGYPTFTLGTEESNLSHCVLDTDSDESVDRGIEEAIQEYLKKKTEESCSITNAVHDVLVPPGMHPAIEHCAPDASDGTSLGGEVVPTDLVSVVPLSAHLTDAANSRCTSPSSISSNDSFELSIQAEIEKFLQDKRDKESSHPVSKVASEGVPALKSKKGCVKPGTGSQTRVVKALVTNASPHVTAIKSTHLGEAGSICKTGKNNERNLKGLKKLAQEKKPTASPSFKDLSKSSNIQRKVQTELPVAKPISITTGAELSDSSSDDGIEEAIQLYQLEQKKSRDMSPALGVLPRNSPCSKGSDLSLDACEGRESARATPPSKRRKQCAPKSQESKTPHSLNFSQTVPNDQLSDDFVKQSERKLADSGISLNRTETPSELSRQQGGVNARTGADGSTGRIPLGGEERADSWTTPSERTTAGSHQIIFSDSEDSSVDSSDSIEKEIQSYLALKVSISSQKSNGVGTLNEPGRDLPSELMQENSLSNPPSLPSPSSSSRVQLLPKESLGNDVSIDHKLETEELRGSQQKITEAPVCKTNSGIVIFKDKPEGDLLERDAFDGYNTQDGGKAVTSNPGKLSPITWAASEQSCHNKPLHDAWQTDDKSSSLDSDEDLDTATKDLLKTRKRLGKRLRDSKSQSRKRVRFTGAEVLTFSEQSSGLGDQTPKAAGEGFALSHAPLKSCLSKTSRAVCRSYLDVKSKNNKRRVETSEGDGHGKVAGMGKSTGGSLSAAPSTLAVGQNPKNMASSESSSGDSDDGIEQEILRFLAEKARAAEESLKAKEGVQGFTGQGEESRSSEVPGLGGKMLSVPQQTEGACVKGPRLEEAEVAADHACGGTGSGAAEDKCSIDGRDLVQDLHAVRSAEHQTEHGQVVGGTSTAIQTETTTGVDQGSLLVDGPGCQREERCSSRFDLHGEILLDREINEPLGSGITQNLQEKRTTPDSKTIQLLVQGQCVQYIDSREPGVGQLQAKAVQVRPSEKTKNKLKSWSVFLTDLLSDTVPKDKINVTSSEDRYSTESQSHAGCSTEQRPHATHSHLGWTSGSKTKPDQGAYLGRPSPTPMPSVSAIAHSSESRGLPCVTWQEQNDHNYQSGTRKELRAKQDVRFERSAFVTPRSGPNARVPIAVHSTPSTRQETGSVDQGIRSTESGKPLVRAEGSSKAKASSQPTGKEGDETSQACQWRPLRQVSLESQNEEENDRERRTGEAAEGKRP